MSTQETCARCGTSVSGNTRINGIPYCHDTENRCYELMQRVLQNRRSSVGKAYFKYLSLEKDTA